MLREGFLYGGVAYTAWIGRAEKPSLFRLCGYPGSDQIWSWPRVPTVLPPYLADARRGDHNWTRPRGGDPDYFMVTARNCSSGWVYGEWFKARTL